MNIFCLDEDPVIAAQYHCDKHNCKMILEATQLLCTAFWMQGIEAPYRKTHFNHPIAIWARASKKNFDWLFDHAIALCDEYTFRYGKFHKSASILMWVNKNRHELKFDAIEQTEFAVAISQEQRCRMHPNFENLSVVHKYREYYNYDKASFCKWTKRKPQEWFKPVVLAQ